MCPQAQRLTIASVLTPPGVAAIAVLRLDGPRTLDILQAIFRPFRGQLGDALASDRLRYGRLTDGAEVLDDVLLSLLGGENGVRAADISVHGGARVVARVLQLLERHGALVRSPGEDDDRASWPAGSEVEREADVALSHARTRRAVEFLATQRSVLPAHLAELIRRATADPGGVRAELERLACTWDTVRFLVQGAEVGVVGPPNTGKSTLTNRLTDTDATLASPHAGTTRDWTIHETAIDGIPLSFVDTAGLSATVEFPATAESADFDDLDRTAVVRGVHRIRASDLHLLVVDATAPDALDTARRIVDGLAPRRLLVVVNKADLAPRWPPERLRDLFSNIAAPVSGAAYHVSATRGDGIAGLQQAIVAQLGLAGFDPSGASLFTARQAAVAGRASDGSLVDTVRLGGVLRRLLGEFGSAGGLSLGPDREDSGRISPQ